jgi:intracellular sulfur oxidation DsrE/DsrF family protein
MTRPIVHKIVAALAGLAALATALSAAGQTPPSPAPAVPGYGKMVPIDGLAVLPDPALRYRVLFSVTTPAKDPKELNHSLEKVARFANLLASAGVRPQPGDLVAIVYSGATPIVTNDATYAALTKVEKNPNLDLIKKLQDAGVTVAVCRQALAGREIDPATVAPGVRVDASAITTIATLQLRGWVYIDD